MNEPAEQSVPTLPVLPSNKHIFSVRLITLILLLVISLGILGFVFVSRTVTKQSSTSLPIIPTISPVHQDPKVMTYSQVLGEKGTDGDITNFMVFSETTLPTGDKRFYGEMKYEDRLYASLEMIGQQNNIQKVTCSIYGYKDMPDSTIGFFAARVLHNLEPETDSFNEWLIDIAQGKIRGSTIKIDDQTYEGNFSYKKITYSVTQLSPDSSKETFVIIPNLQVAGRYMSEEREQNEKQHTEELTGDYSKRIAQYTTGINQGSDYYLQQRGELYYELGEYDKALADFMDYIKRGGEFQKTMNENIVITYYSMRNIDKALEVARKEKLTDLETGLLIRQGKNQEALRIYEERLQDQVTDYKTQAAGEYKNKTGEFEMYIKKRATQNEGDYTAYETIANMYARLGDDKKALELYNKSIIIQKEYEAIYHGLIDDSYRARGDYYLYKSQYDNAITDYSVILNQNANFDKNVSVPFHTARAAAYIKKQDYVHALEDLNYLLDDHDDSLLNSERLPAMKLRAYIYKVQNNTIQYDSDETKIKEMEKSEDKDKVKIGAGRGDLKWAYKFFANYSDILK